MKEYSADAGTALPDTPDLVTLTTVMDPVADSFAHLSLAQIAPSLTNPRKHFNPARLTELAESIRASGVHQPILVRPLPGHRVSDTMRNVTHEVVSGERRYRASDMAGQATIPALIRHLTDDQVLEIQLVENLQRDDLTELEEAEGYQALMAATKLTKDMVADKIGKSRSYVYARLKLLDLSTECRKALREGTIDASRALLIARIPDGKLQTKALTEASRKDFHGELAHSVRAFSTWLQGNVMLRLEHATFKITDTHLVEAAGSCKTCPKRTGASPDLFADVSDADICTDPTCFNAKTEAHRTALRTKAEAKGMRIIDGKEAKEICKPYRNVIDGYSRLSQHRDDAKEPATLAKLLGKDAPAPVLIENPWTKELIEAVPTDEAEGVLLAKGLLKATEVKAKQDNQAKGIEWDIDRLKEQAERETAKAARLASAEALRTAVHAHKTPATLITPPLLRAWLMGLTDEYDTGETLADCANVDLPDNCDAEEYMRLHFQTAPSEQLYRAAVLWMVSQDHFTDTDSKATHEALAISTKVDLDLIAKQAAKDVKTDTAQRIAQLRKQLKAMITPAKTDDIEGPAAQASTGANKAKPPLKPGAKAAPARRPKMSAEEAKAGIAAAMQSAERPATAQAEAAPSAPALPFPVGSQVRIIKDEDRLQTIKRKHAGKTGTVTALLGVNVRDVTFKGRSGGLVSFILSELEAVAS